MAETLPRFGLPAVDFIAVDASDIQAEIINGYEAAAGRTLATGDPVRLFLLTVADAVTQLRNAVNIAARQNLLSYAQGDFLESLGAFFGVSRLAASSAVTTIRFSLSQALGQDLTIPAGTLVGAGTAVTFSTDEDLVIAEGAITGDVQATCTVSGTDGNGYVAGQVSTIVEPMAYVASAANTSVTAGGGDAESDEDLAERIRLAPSAFSVAGPEKAYLYHAYSSNAAIEDVAVESPEDQPGVVNIYLLMTGGVLPTEDVCASVQDYLSADDIRPLTDDVHVYAPEKVVFAITVDYWIAQDDASRAETIRTAVEGAVAEYRAWQQAAIGRDIDTGRLVQMVMAAGASRVDMTTLTPSAFVELDRSQVAQCTGSTVTFKGFKDI